MRTWRHYCSYCCYCYYYYYYHQQHHHHYYDNYYYSTTTTTIIITTSNTTTTTTITTTTTTTSISFLYKVYARVCQEYSKLYIYGTVENQDYTLYLLMTILLCVTVLEGHREIRTPLNICERPWNSAALSYVLLQRRDVFIGKSRGCNTVPNVGTARLLQSSGLFSASTTAWPTYL